MVRENLFKIFKTSDQSVFSHCENIAIKFILTLVHFFLIVSAQKKKQSKRKKELPKHKQENFLFKLILTCPLIQPAQIIFGSQGLNLKQRMSSGASSSNYDKQGISDSVIDS